MITENLPTLKINKLTQAQYDAAKSAGTINENELYMTPDDGSDIDLSNLVDLSNEQTISGAKTFSTDLTASSNLSVGGNITATGTITGSIKSPIKRCWCIDLGRDCE